MFVKGYKLLSSAKNLGKNIGKNMSKSLSGRYSQNTIDYVKQSATDAFKLTSKIQQKQLVIWLPIKLLKN